MAKHITKSVIEDIAYEIKRIGIITSAYENGIPTEEMIANFGEIKDFDTSGTDTLDWLVQSLEDVFICHDPTFDLERFKKQAAWKVEI